jgi:hypothetical protein
MTAAPSPGSRSGTGTAPSHRTEAGAGAPAPNRGRGGPPLWFALFGIGGLVAGVLLIAAQVLGLGTGGAAAPATLAPVGEGAAKTRDVVLAALESAAFQVQDPRTAYRPGESPALVAVPRVVLQAVMPADRAAGYVVIYELPTNGEADTAGRDYAAYLASGPGAIQYPRDAQFVLRRLGRTLVFFPWSPSVSPDPEVARLAATLGEIGEPVTGP